MTQPRSSAPKRTESKAAAASASGFVGRPVERVEDAALLSGRALFSDSLPTRTGTLHAAILRSPHAHAEIRSIDLSGALSQPGVAAALSGADVAALSEPFQTVLRQPMQHWCLAVDRVRYVGEAVAVVVAADRYKAEDALEHIEVVYEPLDPVVDQERAAAEGAPLLYPEVGSNVVSTRDFIYGDPQTAFAEADRTVKLKVRYPRNSQTPLEGFVVVADHSADDNAYDVASNFQGPYTTQPVMARALKVPSTHLRLRTPAYSGGGFGLKVQIFPYIVLMCLASRKAGRPVKWVEDRLEHLSAAGAAPNRVIEIEAAVKDDGTVTAFRFDQLDDYGAYLRAPMPGPLYRMQGIMNGAYDIKNLAVTNRVVMTNKCPSAMVRGFGGPQVYYAIERIMQRVAAELEIDPLELRRRNLVPTGAFPYRTAGGALYDSGDYPKAVDLAVNEGGLEALKRRREEARKEGRLYGIGYAAVVESAQSNMGYVSNILPPEERRKNPKSGAVSNATVNVDPLGNVSVTADSIPQGQGHATILSQIVADRLGLTPTDIRVNMEHDTHKDAWSIATGNYSSRFTSSTAVATDKAAVRVRDKLARIASQTLNVPADKLQFAGGKVFAADNPDNAIGLYRAAGAAHWQASDLPAGLAPGVRETVTWSPPELTSPDEQGQINMQLTYTFLFDFCGIEVDRDTGEVRIEKYVTVHDPGRILNPLLVNGQVYGAYAWGVAAALYEEFAYGEDGSFLTGTFADYLCPTACEVPEPVILHMETPSMISPLGAKGIGEGNCMSVPVCIANAVCDAIGVENVTLPLSPAKLSALIHAEEAAPPSGPAAEAAEAPAPGKRRTMSGAGETVVPAPPEQVWRTMLDPDELAAVIPGCHSLEADGEDSYRAEVTLGVGPVRGRFLANVALSDLEPPRAATLSGGLAGPLGSSRGNARVRLEPQADGTRVSYDYEVEVTGKVAAVGGRMLEGAARLLIRQFFERLAAQVGGDHRPGGPGASKSWWRRALRSLGLAG
jgi:2-furoyl-CoA dehydrogenase large subunit